MLQERDSVSRAFGRALSSLLVYCRAQLHELGGELDHVRLSSKLEDHTHTNHMYMHTHSPDGKSDLQLQAAASPLLPLLTFLVPLLSHPSHCSSGLPLLDSLHSQVGEKNLKKKLLFSHASHLMAVNCYQWFQYS